MADDLVEYDAFNGYGKTPAVAMCNAALPCLADALRASAAGETK